MLIDKRSLSFKLWTACLLPLAPLMLVLVLLTSQASENLEQMAECQLTRSANSLRLMCASQQEMVQQSLDQGVALAGHLLAQLGGGKPVALDASQSQPWKAIHQRSRAVQEVSLPNLTAGNGSALGRDETLVDKVKELSGGATCTIFQRMNPQGDFLRVATNVRGKDGQRAIGTYIPAESPVAQALAAGKPYRGRAFVVDRWYITSYQPLKDAAGQVVAALYVGVPKEFTQAMADNVRQVIDPEQGFGFVMEGDGRMVVHPSLAGQNVLAADGAALPAGQRQAFADMTAALKAGRQDLAALHMPSAQGGALLVRYTTFAPWDWVIGVVAEEDKVLAGVAGLRAWGLGMLAAALVLAGLCGWWTTRAVRRPLRRAVAGLRQGVGQVNASSGALSESSQRLAEGSGQQAASLDQSSAGLEEMASMTQGAATNAQQATDAAEQTRQVIGKAGQEMEQMARSMAQIAESGGKISRIVKSIDEIAFQTNLLALNAAVEAARAGEAGAGFAVVAEEVRNLALRAATAARDTQALIEETVASINQGATLVDQVREGFGVAATASERIDAQVREIASSCSQQVQGIAEVSKAMNQMDVVVHQNASLAQETAGAAQELETQAARLAAVVHDLAALANLRGADGDGLPAGPGLPTPTQNLPVVKRF
ncbi:MAG: Cache 3/Cache 2 fusion domain-containing protein [Pseudomonadota bacterium]